MRTSWQIVLDTWPSYAVATGAALAAATSAQADIIYTHPATPLEAALANGPDYTGNTNKSQRNGLFQISVGNRSAATHRTAFAQLQAGFLATTLGTLINFRAGSPISFPGTRSFGVLRGAFAACHCPVTRESGPFQISQTGFAGFKTLRGGHGWIRLEVLDRNHDGFPDAVEAIDWAYNNVSGGAIEAGQVPEPGTASLALLASGAAGLLAWRKRRAAKSR